MSTITAIQSSFSAESDFIEVDAPLESSHSKSSTLQQAGRWPGFETQSGIYAVTARQAGRLNATTATDGELTALLNERQMLLDKQFDGTISRAERNRLIYVGWSLDRIEDARYGGALDELESAVSRYERFSEDLELLQRQINQSKRSSRR